MPMCNTIFATFVTVMVVGKYARTYGAHGEGTYAVGAAYVELVGVWRTRAVPIAVDDAGKEPRGDIEARVDAEGLMKQGIIEQLKALIEDTGENIQEKVRSLTDEYNTIGHVPFKEKDKLYKEYHEVLDRKNTRLNSSHQD